MTARANRLAQLPLREGAPVRGEHILGLPVCRGRWSSVVTITPEQAIAILQAQPKQRDVKQSFVEFLVVRIRAGEFHQTHQGIAFDEDGRLGDGQHRMWACFLAGLPITVSVAFNEPRDLFPFLDIGTNRDGADRLQIAGRAPDRRHALTLAGAVRFLWAYDLGVSPTNASTRPDFTDAAQRETLANHPMLADTAARRVARRQRSLVPSAPFAALLVMFAEADPHRAARFEHQVDSGEGLVLGDPALSLRTSLLHAARRRERRADIPYKIARAWNAFHEGRPLLKLFGVSSPNGTKARLQDVFPTIAGYVRPRDRPPPRVGRVAELVRP